MQYIRKEYLRGWIPCCEAPCALMPACLLYSTAIGSAVVVTIVWLCFYFPSTSLWQLQRGEGVGRFSEFIVLFFNTYIYIYIYIYMCVCVCVCVCVFVGFLPASTMTRVYFGGGGGVFNPLWGSSEKKLKNLFPTSERKKETRVNSTPLIWE
ncbi:hypothetical protein, unlikely [Trypanosoma brucei gambiense DAL972]|uniref:T. brucei spp.-specific protein n=1 Tax=Trypanosoma brucei gambiense (strain MHOM/CI/86/DAL972) TaxID=679716 RepID=D0A0P2_TRYB9|nr:hypothetical protein, unlikely [Trypanosoma brucei gambiense DAL972]CBH16800.1 hypothetical protein, unlikely [Trypanosoma brucei gambiense DAL972]|eukprot:XP_011779064.1 hypothetical protein, unlikely [Trypanosoma brucei gambiense DAL972]